MGKVRPEEGGGVYSSDTELGKRPGDNPSSPPLPGHSLQDTPMRRLALEDDQGMLTRAPPVYLITLSAFGSGFGFGFPASHHSSHALRPFFKFPPWQ